MAEQIVYLVWFENHGYYAEKQPEYEWSFTDDPLLAKHYKTVKSAEQRGTWGLELSNPLNLNPTKYEVRRFKVMCIMEPA